MSAKYRNKGDAKKMKMASAAGASLSGFWPTHHPTHTLEHIEIVFFNTHESLRFAPKARLFTLNSACSLSNIGRGFSASGAYCSLQNTGTSSCDKLAQPAPKQVSPRAMNVEVVDGPCALSRGCEECQNHSSAQSLM